MSPTTAITRNVHEYNIKWNISNKRRNSWSKNKTCVHQSHLSVSMENLDLSRPVIGIYCFTKFVFAVHRFLIKKTNKSRWFPPRIGGTVIGATRAWDVAPWWERSLVVRWVVGSILYGEPIELFSWSSQCSTTGVTKAVVCVILSVGWYISKNPCCLSERVAHAAAAGFLFRYLRGPLSYVWRYRTVNQMCWVRR